MSTAAKRSRVTDVVGRLHAQALDVTTAGDLVALHCHTHTGTIVVTVPLLAFQAAARGPRDGNGRPWPEPRRSSREVLETDAEQTRRILAAMPTTSAPTSPPYTQPTLAGKITRVRMTPERWQRIDAAAARIIATGEPAKAVADEIGEPVNYLYKSLGRLRRQTRQPVLKPGGTIL